MVDERVGPRHPSDSRQAAKKVEDSWFDAVKGTALDVPVDVRNRNAYAAAKGRA